MALKDAGGQLQEQQQANRFGNRISSFIEKLQIGSLLNASRIKKLRGTYPLALFKTIFMLPFEGNNFYRGIVLNGRIRKAGCLTKL